MNRTSTAHAFTSTSSAYAVENTDTVKVQRYVCQLSVGDKIQMRGTAPTNNKNNKVHNATPAKHHCQT